jgi:hypothetical protein
MSKIILLIAMVGSTLVTAQTLSDGLMMPKNDFCTGVIYNYDRWENYWEGSLKRDNGNIGSVTTQLITWVGNFGISDKFNIIAMLPYVKTDASQGTMLGMDGLQDLTLGVKYQAVSAPLGSGTIKGFIVGMASTPLSNYTPDFLPLSIGLASTNVGGRLTANYTLENGFYGNVSGGYTWRSNVSIDRPSYYTAGHIYFTNEVQMPNVVDYNVNLGFLRSGLQIELLYQQQNVLGGGDIRRQDMPFVSNRMNFSKVGVMMMYYLPFHKNLAVRAMINQTIAGRNVGQSTSLLGGFLYTLHFRSKEAKPKQITSL